MTTHRVRCTKHTNTDDILTVPLIYNGFIVGVAHIDDRNCIKVKLAVDDTLFGAQIRQAMLDGSLTNLSIDLELK